MVYRMIDKNIQAEIDYRHELMKRAANGEKWTKAEREWSLTHIIYNNNKGYPYMCRDIIQLKSNTEYKVTVRIISNLSESYASPVIGVANGKGAITILSGYLENHSGEVSKKNTTKVLSTNINSVGSEDTVLFKSELGLLEVGFQNRQTHAPHNYTSLCTSSSPNHGLYMFKEIVSDNHVIYKCNKFDLKDRDDAFVFEMEWNEVDHT